MMWGNLLSHVTGQETPPELPEFLQQGRGLSGYPIILVRDIPLTCRPQPCCPHILPTYIRAYHWPTGSSTPGLPGSHQKFIQCLTSLSSLSLSLPRPHLAHSSTVWVPPLIALPPRKELAISIPPPSLICFCLTRGPFVHLPSIGPLPSCLPFHSRLPAQMRECRGKWHREGTVPGGSG